MSLPAEPTTLEEWKSRCAALEQQVAELAAKLRGFEEQHRLALRRHFGRSSERSVHPDQLALVFDEAEATAAPSEPEPTFETITIRRKKARGHREAALAELPVERVEHRLPEAARQVGAI